MAYARIEHAGGAVSTTLATDITSGATSLSLTAGSTWPTGATGPFYLVIDPATSAEEKILATARSTNSLTGLTRGVDGTSAAAHSAGAVIKHIFSAAEADEANQLVKQTLGSVTTKGDLTPASAAGTLTRLAVGSNDLPLVADSAQTTGLKYAALTATALASGSVSLAKFGTGLRPVFEVADTTALNALTPTAGDVAYKADDNKLYAYRGAAWGLVDTQVRQIAVTGGPVSSTTVTLATLVVAALPATYQIECSAFWTPVLDTTADNFTFSIFVDTVAKGTVHVRASSTNERYPFVIPTSTLTTIAANTASTVEVKAVRGSGSGTATEEVAGLLTARLLPL